MHVSGLLLNSKKTKCLLFGSRNLNLIFKIRCPTCQAAAKCVPEIIKYTTDIGILDYDSDGNLGTRDGLWPDFYSSIQGTNKHGMK